MVLRSKSGVDGIEEIRTRWKDDIGTYESVSYDSGIKIVDAQTGEKVAWINGGADCDKLASRFVNAHNDFVAVMEAMSHVLSELERREEHVAKAQYNSLELVRLRDKSKAHLRECGFLKTKLGRVSRTVSSLENKVGKLSKERARLRRNIRSLENKIYKSEEKSEKWRAKYENEKAKPRFVADCNLPGERGLSGRRGERRCIK